MDLWAKNRGTTHEIVSFMVFCLCALAYGGVHAGAWDDYFPMSVERLLWRVSAISVAALGITAMLGFIGYQVASNIHGAYKYQRFPHGSPRWEKCMQARLMPLTEYIVDYFTQAKRLTENYLGYRTYDVIKGIFS